MPRHSWSVVAALLCAAVPLLAQRPTHPSGAVLRKIPLTGHPYGVAIDRQDEVYVSRVHSGQLLRVGFAPGADGEVTEIGVEPPHVVVSDDGRWIFATLQKGRAVVRIDSRTGVTEDSVTLGSDGFNLALDPDGEHLVATAAAGWAYRLDRRPLRLLDSAFVGAAANGVVFDRRGTRVYVSSRDAGSVTALDAETFRPVATWTPGGALQRLALGPDGRSLFVADESRGGGVSRIDTRSGRIEHLAIDGTPYGLGVSPDGQRLWVLLLDRGEVAMFDLPSLRATGIVDVGGRPRNVAFTARGDRAAVTTESALVLLR